MTDKRREMEPLPDAPTRFSYGNEREWRAYAATLRTMLEAAREKSARLEAQLAEEQANIDKAIEMLEGGGSRRLITSFLKRTRFPTHPLATPKEPEPTPDQTIAGGEESPMDEQEFLTFGTSLRPTPDQTKDTGDRRDSATQPDLVPTPAAAPGVREGGTSPDQTSESPDGETTEEE